MLVSPTDVRRMVRQELKVQLDEIRKLIMGKGTVGNWVKQDMACIMLDVKSRRLRDIRYHQDAAGKVVGSIKWRKGKGKTIEYWKPDIEKFLNHITVG